MVGAHKDKEIFGSPNAVIPGCTTQYSLPTKLRPYSSNLLEQFQTKSASDSLILGMPAYYKIACLSSSLPAILESAASVGK